MESDFRHILQKPIDFDELDRLLRLYSPSGAVASASASVRA